MPVENRTWKFMVPLVGSLFLAAACSSSNDPMVDMEPEPQAQCGTSGQPDCPPPVIALETFLATGSDPVTGNAADTDNDNAAQNIARQTAVAATAAVTGDGTTGGVSQTSDATARSTQADFTVGTNSDGATTYSVNLGTHATDAFTLDTTSDAELERIEGQDNAVSFELPLGVTESVPEGTGTLYVWARSDTPNSVGGDDDYLAYGFWIHDPATHAAADVPIIGAFVDSNQDVVFPVGSLAALTGSATYTGGAEGLYHEEIPGAETGDPATSRFAAWTADASMTAIFDSTDTVSGEITGFEGLPEGVSVTTVTLGASPLGTDEGGFFTMADQATAMVDLGGTDTSFTGDWGGKFYGDLGGTDVTNNYPGTVAGTFGLAATTTDTYRAFLGIFHADLDE